MTDNTVRPWMRLDNAGLIYPATMNNRWNALFRLSADLTEEVDPDILAKAHESALARCPWLCVKLKNGMFWYYLEHSPELPPVQEDVANPCVRMKLRDTKGMGIRVRYYHKRIAVEIFHVLTDGTGGLVFLKTLVAEYLRLKYGADIPRGNGILDCSRECDASEAKDAFQNNAGEFTASRSESASFRIKGTPEDDGFINITTGEIDSARLVERAKTHGGTVTEYLTGVMILSVDAMQRRKTHRTASMKPVKVCVPINLRRIFPADTLRNFSSYTNPGIDPRLGMYTLDEVIARTRNFMRLEVDEKQLRAKITTNVMTQKNKALAIAPLFMKNAAMRLVYSVVGDRITSTCLSNLGVAKLPEEMARYVTRMDFILGPLAVNPVCAAMLSYNGITRINFTRTIMEPALEREFFTRLVKDGLHVAIESNLR